jgi:uncharacterized protein (TIGR03643 family)
VELNAVQIDRVIEMAWEDRTPFEAIAYQFSLAEKDVIAVMRKELKKKFFQIMSRPG